MNAHRHTLLAALLAMTLGCAAGEIGTSPPALDPDAASDATPDAAADTTPDATPDVRPPEDTAEDAPPTEDTAPDASEDAPPTEDTSTDAPEDAPPTEDTSTDTPEDAPPTEDTAPDAAAPFDPVYPAQRVGIFYLTWHAFAADAMRRIPAQDRLTIEDVIADPQLQFSQVMLDRGLFNEAAAFHYHAEPEPGFYCLYRRRPTDPVYAEPNAVDDCPDVSVVARRHADQLWSAGIDFVYVDLTNLPVWGEFGDVLGLRPLEVLLEEWAALRTRGIPTPQVAAWVPAAAVDAAQTPMFRKVLELYANPAFADLLLRHAPANRPVLFVVDSGGLQAHAPYLDEIAAQGVIPVRLWGNLGASTLASGVAGWMQPCTDGGAFTTLIAPDRPCQQGHTPNTPIGDVLSVSTSFQVGYASAPFQASGRNNGLTLKKQFETAFAVQPDYLLINAWNEHIAQPQPNPYLAALGPLRRSMGVTAVDGANPGADWLWVDMYGTDLSRDLEPTVERGSVAYQTLASCLRVYRSGLPTCTDAAEVCCHLTGAMTLIRSVRGRDATNALNTHHVLTTGTHERDTLVGSGAWEEVCNLHYGPPGLCGGGTTGDGPFMLFAEPAPDRALLYRCTTGVANFFSLDPNCEGTTIVGPLGYLSLLRSSDTPRPLRRCYNPAAQVHFHWLDERCPSLPGVREEGILGYVR